MKQKARGGDANEENEVRERRCSRPPAEIKAEMRAVDTEIRELVNALIRLQLMRKGCRNLARHADRLGRVGGLA